MTCSSPCKGFFQRLLRMCGILLAGVAVGFGLLTAVFMLPVDSMEQHVLESLPALNGEWGTGEESYEQVVKELSAKFGFDIHKCKTCYDCISLVASVILSFCFFGFGHFEAVKWGTLGCALLTGWIISRFSRFFEKHFVFQDRWPYRHLFV